MRKARIRDDEQAIASFEHTRKTKSVPIHEKRTTHYGNTIRKYREALDMDQKTVAAALGYSTNTISNWENGVSRPDIDAIPELCALLQIPLPVFFAVEHDPAAPETERTLVRDFRMLSKAHQQSIAQLTRQLAAEDIGLRQKAKEMSRCLVLPVEAVSAAVGTGVPAEPAEAVERVFVLDNRLARQADTIYRVNGDSMEPDYHDGDQVYVKHVHDLPYGEVGIFVVDGALYIKEYRKSGLYSYNRSYRLMKLFADNDVRLIGKVLGRVAEQDLYRFQAD